MKATLEIPDELYRRVKARSAMEGRPVRAVAVELFAKWVEEAPKESAVADVKPELDFEKMPWLKITQKYVYEGQNHDWDRIDEAIATGWGEHVAEKLKNCE